MRLLHLLLARNGKPSWVLRGIRELVAAWVRPDPCEVPATDTRVCDWCGEPAASGFATDDVILCPAHATAAEAAFRELAAKMDAFLGR